MAMTFAAYMLYSRSTHAVIVAATADAGSIQLCIVLAHLEDIGPLNSDEMWVRVA
jgi:hypothetical protein